MENPYPNIFVFRLSQTENSYFHTVLYEIQKQVNYKDCENLNVFLNKEIDVKKHIYGTKKLNIIDCLTKLFEFIKLDEKIDPLNRQKFSVRTSFSILELWLSIKIPFSNLDHPKIENKNFFGLDSYKRKYKVLEDLFLKSTFDTDEMDFIRNEIKECDNILSEIENPFYDNTDFKTKIFHTISKRKTFLKDKIKDTQNQLTSVITEAEPTIEFQKLNWQGTQTELTELIKALIENGSIKGTQKDIINAFSEFLNFKINNPSKLINDIKTNRNNGNETIFLDSLKTSLLNFITKENRR